MDLTTMGVGGAAVLFGAYTTVLRVRNPARLGKLEAMKRTFGETTGALVHLLAYSVAPLAAGVCFLAAGLTGVGLF